MRMTVQLPELIEESSLIAELEAAISYGLNGSVTAAQPTVVHASCLPAPLGSICEIHSKSQGTVKAQVIGFEDNQTLLSCLDGSHGIALGDNVRFCSSSNSIPVSNHVLGKIIDCMGQESDACGEQTSAKPASSGDPSGTSIRNLMAAAPSPTQRRRIEEVLHTGVRAIDAFATIGRGQRVGIFAGSGVGKSRLLGMLARGTSADIVVVGLIGERGREVQEFFESEIDEATRNKCVVVAETSDKSALRRIQAAHAATAIAEHFRDQGKDVLLVMDSVTRFAMAQREVGLASGEAPTTRGYPSSVFSMLPQLVERAGMSGMSAGSGSITGIYTVLVEGDDPNEPISDALRGLLDGHIHLSRSIAETGRYPAIDVLSSLSRLQTRLIDENHQSACRVLRKLMSDYSAHEDLITIGAYQDGTTPSIDQAIGRRRPIEEFLTQDVDEKAGWQETVEALMELAQ